MEVEGIIVEKCPQSPFFPKCFVRVRTVANGDEKGVLPESTDELDIGIEINGAIYSIGEIIEYGETAMTTEFLLTDEMLDPDLGLTNTYFVVAPLEPDGNNWTGPVEFVNPDECPDVSEEAHFSLKRRPHMPPPFRYIVSVFLKTKKDNV